MMEPEIIQRFLESVGQKADIDLYLKLFRAQKRESFAILCPGAQVIRNALDPLHFDLRILAGLGLQPIVLLGLWDGRDADKQAQRVYDWLVEDQVPARIISAAPAITDATLTAIRDGLGGGAIPILSLEGVPEATVETRFDLLRDIARPLETRRILFLSTRPGLEREGAPHISVVNVSTDYDHLLQNGHLSRRHQTLLRQGRQLLDELPQRATLAVVNPLHLLRELFTVGGAGTLIRKGSRIERHDGVATVDRPRLQGLLESAFGKKLAAGVLDRPIDRVYIDENYLGVAIVSPSPVGPYLSKFAVERQAQGEGIGGDLWAALIKDYESFFWRARPSNPIVPWYVRHCDGLVRFPEWHVYWRGLSPERIQPAIEYALAAPVDLVPPPGA